jgi:hypothetical protein
MALRQCARIIKSVTSPSSLPSACNALMNSSFALVLIKMQRLSAKSFRVALSPSLSPDKILISYFLQILKELLNHLYTDS